MKKKNFFVMLLMELLMLIVVLELYLRYKNSQECKLLKNEDAKPLKSPFFVNFFLLKQKGLNFLCQNQAEKI